MPWPKYITDTQHVLGRSNASIVRFAQMLRFTVLREFQHLLCCLGVLTDSASVSRVNFPHRGWHGHAPRALFGLSKHRC